MNKIIYLIIIGCVSFVLLVNNQKEDSNQLDSTKNILLSGDSDALTTVEKFWLFSLEGQNFEVEKLLTEIPDDYYKMLNFCAEVSGENAEKLANNESGFVQLTKGIDEYRKTSEFNLLTQFSSNIEKNQYDFYNISIKRQTQTHALIEAAFGKENYLYYKENFLLVNENGSWKIFTESKFFIFTKR